MSRLSRWFRVEQVSINAYEVLFWGGCVVLGLVVAGALVVWSNRHPQPQGEQEKPAVVAPPAPQPPPPPAEPKPPLAERAGQAVGRGGVQLGRGLWDGVRQELFGKDE